MEESVPSWGPSQSVPDEMESACKPLESPLPPALARKRFHEFGCNVLSNPAPHTFAVFANSAQSAPQLHTALLKSHPCTHARMEKVLCVPHPRL